MQMNQTSTTATAPTTAAKFISSGLRAVFADGLGAVVGAVTVMDVWLVIFMSYLFHTLDGLSRG